MDDIAISNDEFNHSHSSRKCPLPPNSPDSKTVIPSTLKILRRKLDIDDSYMIASIYSDSTNSYDEAISCKNKNHWINAIKDELNNLYSNKIMTFFPKVPPGKNIISTKWVFATKKDSNNFMYKYKARLVARGFRQKWGIDYDLIYSPTLNIDSLKFIFALSAAFHWDIFSTRY